MKDTGGSSVANVAVLAALAFIAAIAFAWPVFPKQKSQPVVATALAEPKPTAGARREALIEAKPVQEQDMTGSAGVVRVRLGDAEERSLRRANQDCADDQ